MGPKDKLTNQNGLDLCTKFMNLEMKECKSSLISVPPGKFATEIHHIALASSKGTGTNTEQTTFAQPGGVRIRD